MLEIKFDSSGYITENTQNKIKNWEFFKKEDLNDFYEYVSLALDGHYSFFSRDGEIIKISTGGWSPNELVIECMKKNIIFWSLYWEESKKGGHFKFKIK